MNEQEIQKAADDLCKQMMEKGLAGPRVSIDFRSNDIPQIYLKSDGVKTDYLFIRGGNAQEAIRKAVKAIRDMPSKEDLARNAFLQTLASAIEQGAKIGIDVEFINPLREAMMKLSENALPAPIPDPRDALDF